MERLQQITALDAVLDFLDAVADLGEVLDPCRTSLAQQSCKLFDAEASFLCVDAELVDGVEVSPDVADTVLRTCRYEVDGFVEVHPELLNDGANLRHQLRRLDAEGLPCGLSTEGYLVQLVSRDLRTQRLLDGAQNLDGFVCRFCETLTQGAACFVAKQIEFGTREASLYLHRLQRLAKVLPGFECRSELFRHRPNGIGCKAERRDGTGNGCTEAADSREVAAFGSGNGLAN